jgi:DNA repair protein RadC
MHGFIDYYTLTTLVLKAQVKAFSSLSGIGHAKLGTMTSLVVVANTIVQEVANDL